MSKGRDIIPKGRVKIQKDRYETTSGNNKKIIKYQKVGDKCRKVGLKYQKVGKNTKK